MSKIATELRDSFNKFNLGKEKFDIGTIKAAHIAWKLKLGSMLNKGAAIPLNEIKDHTQCDFGQWIATNEGRALESHTFYADMIKKHEKIHTLAYQIASLYMKGQKDSAMKLMGEFDMTTQELFSILDKMFVEQ